MQCGSDDLVQILPRLCGQVWRLSCQLGETQDSIERLVQLVGDPRRHFTDGGQTLGVDELFLKPAALLLDVFPLDQQCYRSGNGLEKIPLLPEERSLVKRRHRRRVPHLQRTPHGSRYRNVRTERLPFVGDPAGLVQAFVDPKPRPGRLRMQPRGREDLHDPLQDIFLGRPRLLHQQGDLVETGQLLDPLAQRGVGSAAEQRQSEMFRNLIKLGRLALGEVIVPATLEHDQAPVDACLLIFASKHYEEKRSRNTGEIVLPVSNPGLGATARKQSGSEKDSQGLAPGRLPAWDSNSPGE